MLPARNSFKHNVKCCPRTYHKTACSFGLSRCHWLRSKLRLIIVHPMIPQTCLLFAKCEEHNTRCHNNMLLTIWYRLNTKKKNIVYRNKINAYSVMIWKMYQLDLNLPCIIRDKSTGVVPFLFCLFPLLLCMYVHSKAAQLIPPCSYFCTFRRNIIANKMLPPIFLISLYPNAAA